MSQKQLQAVLASARSHDFTSEAEVDAYLLERGLTDPTERICAKHTLEASGQLDLRAAGEMATDQVTDYGLATDRQRYQPEPPGVSREIQTLMRKAGLGPDQTYTEAQLDEALSRAAIGTVERVAVKTSLLQRRQVSAAADRHRLQASRERPRGTKIPGVLRGYSW